MGRIGSKWASANGFVGVGNWLDTRNQRKEAIHDGTRAYHLKTQEKDGAIHKNVQIERGVEINGLSWEYWERMAPLVPGKD